jgi:hypothetical protein
LGFLIATIALSPRLQWLMDHLAEQVILASSIAYERERQQG